MEYILFFSLADEQRVRSGTWEDQTCDKRVTPSLLHSRNLHHSHHTISHRSTDNSWCSESDPELSSDEESDRSATSSTRYFFFHRTILIQFLLPVKRFKAKKFTYHVF